ncbi:hypothetical protein RYX36_019047, partial [Vicia faba]
MNYCIRSYTLVDWAREDHVLQLLLFLKRSSYQQASTRLLYENCGLTFAFGVIT